MAIADNSDKVWYYAKEDGQKYILSENDLIWMTDLDDWISVGNSIYSFYLTH